jgi:hypothetical protein
LATELLSQHANLPHESNDHAMHPTVVAHLSAQVEAVVDGSMIGIPNIKIRREE